jgi:capsular polysaccharide biosynthesis protein
VKFRERGVERPPDRKEGDAVTAHEALRALRQRWWILLAAAVLAAAAAVGYTYLPGVEPRWRSSVLLQATGRLDYGNFLALEKELRPLAEQMRQLGIMREVNANLHTDLPAALILDHTRVEPVVDSDQLRLDVEDSDPNRAEQLSIEIADVYTRQHNAAEQSKLREERVFLSTLERPNDAMLIWPQRRILVPVAGLLGLLVAGAVVLGLVYLDDSIRSPADVQHYVGLPLLGSVPRQRLGSLARTNPAQRPSAADIKKSAEALRL